MLRRLTYTMSIVTVFAGLGLFHIKYQVVELENAHAQTRKDIRDVREEYQVLKAEWALFNEPERLSNLAIKYLKMRPSKTDQLVKEEVLFDSGSSKGEPA